MYTFVILHLFSSAIDQKTKDKVAIKKLYRPFESLIFAKRAYREVRLLRHIQHDNVSCGVFAIVFDRSHVKVLVLYTAYWLMTKMRL